MNNNYKRSESTIVNANEYSTITAKHIAEMIKVKYPLYFNQIRVKIECESEENLQETAKKFINYAKEKFSIVIIQSAQSKSYILTIYSRNNINYIQKTLKSFKEKTTNCQIYY